MKKLKWKLNKLLTEISIDQIAYHPTKLFVDQKLSPYLAQPLVPHLTKPRIRPTHTQKVNPLRLGAFGQRRFQ